MGTEDLDFEKQILEESIDEDIETEQPDILPVRNRHRNKDAIEIRGDYKPRLFKYLRKMGYTPEMIERIKNRTARRLLMEDDYSEVYEELTGRDN